MKQVPTQIGMNSSLDSQTVSRAALRQRALAARLALDAHTRADFDARISARLTDRLMRRWPASIGAYWPMRNEPDLRAAFNAWHAHGVVIALPQVVERGTALRFLRWTPSTRLLTNRYGAAIDGDADVVLPELLLVPCVGFTAQRFRLGYGGGYYDRTLAERHVESWGVAYECCRTDTLVPAAHDMQLDAIYTEATVY